MNFRFHYSVFNAVTSKSFYSGIDDDNNGEEADTAWNINASGMTSVMRKDFDTIVGDFRLPLFLFPSSDPYFVIRKTMTRRKNELSLSFARRLS